MQPDNQTPDATGANASQEPAQPSTTHLNASQGKASGRGSYGSGREQTTPKHDDGPRDMDASRNAQSSSLEDDGRDEDKSKGRDLPDSHSGVL